MFTEQLNENSSSNRLTNGGGMGRPDDILAQNLVLLLDYEMK